MSFLDVLYQNISQKLSIVSGKLNVVSEELDTVSENLEVPAVDNGDNGLMRDVIGNKNDNQNSHSVYSHTHDLWEVLHHKQKVYPTLADPVTVTANAVAWTLGNFAEIIPANAIDSEFHIHHLHITAPSDNGNYELVLFHGTVEIGRVTFSRTDKKDDVEGLAVRTSHVAANGQIQAKLACDTG